MDAYFGLLKEFMRFLYQLRDADLNRFVHTNLTDKETNEVRGGILALNKVIRKCDEYLGDYAKNMNLPYNLRVLEEEFKNYKVKIHIQGKVEDETDYKTDN